MLGSVGGAGRPRVGWRGPRGISVGLVIAASSVDAGPSLWPFLQLGTSDQACTDALALQMLLTAL